MISKINKIVLLLVSLQILSCASFPDPSKTTKGLLVIPLGQENKENLEFFGEYRITFKAVDNESSFTRRITPTGKYALVYLEPGNYEISNVNFVYKNGKHGTITSLSINFLIDHGKISILPIKFITKIYSNDDGGMTMSKTFLRTTVNDKEEIKDYLSKLENFNMWSFK